MPDIKQVMNEEIRRLARKEIKSATVKLQELVSEQRKRISELEKRVFALEKKNNPVSRYSEVFTPAEPTEKTETSTSAAVRVNASGIVKLRRKLNLTQMKFAELLGVNQFSVCNWEAGKTTPRAAVKARIAEIRAMGKREFTKRFGAIADGSGKPRRSRIKKAFKQAAAPDQTTVVAAVAVAEPEKQS